MYCNLQARYTILQTLGQAKYCQVHLCPAIPLKLEKKNPNALPPKQHKIRLTHTETYCGVCLKRCVISNKTMYLHLRWHSWLLTFPDLLRWWCTGWYQCLSTWCSRCAWSGPAHQPCTQWKPHALMSVAFALQKWSCVLSKWWRLCPKRWVERFAKLGSLWPNMLC